MLPQPLRLQPREDPKKYRFRIANLGLCACTACVAVMPWRRDVGQQLQRQAQARLGSHVRGEKR